MVVREILTRPLVGHETPSDAGLFFCRCVFGPEFGSVNVWLFLHGTYVCIAVKVFIYLLVM